MKNEVVKTEPLKRLRVVPAFLWMLCSLAAGNCAFVLLEEESNSSGRLQSFLAFSGEQTSTVQNHRSSVHV